MRVICVSLAAGLATFGLFAAVLTGWSLTAASATGQFRQPNHLIIAHTSYLLFTSRK